MNLTEQNLTDIRSTSKLIIDTKFTGIITEITGEKLDIVHFVYEGKVLNYNLEVVRKDGEYEIYHEYDHASCWLHIAREQRQGESCPIKSIVYCDLCIETQQFLDSWDSIEFEEGEEGEEGEKGLTYEEAYKEAKETTEDYACELYGINYKELKFIIGCLNIFDEYQQHFNTNCSKLVKIECSAYDGKLYVLDNDEHIIDNVIWINWFENAQFSIDLNAIDAIIEKRNRITINLIKKYDR